MEGLTAYTQYVKNHACDCKLSYCELQVTCPVCLSVIKGQKGN